MYGGLFGDLPPTKEQQQQKQQKGGKVNETLANAAPLEGCDSNKSEIDAKEVADFSKQKKEPPSVVRHLGTSGSAVAFIPAAARRKNLKRPAVPSTSNTKSTKESRSTAAVASSLPEVATASTEIAKRQQDSEVVPVLQKTESKLTASMPQHARETQKNDDNRYEESKETYSATIFSTEQHTHRSDRYDPFLPNDLLEYWERKAVEESWHAQTQAEQQLRRCNREQAEQLRRQQEDEMGQRKPEEPSRGRGRGGLSNLPAWMVEQQRRQDALGSNSTGI